MAIEMMVGTKEAVVEVINEAMHALHMRLQELHRTGWVPVHESQSYESEDPELSAMASLDLSGLIEEMDLPGAAVCLECKNPVEICDYDVARVKIDDEDMITEAYGEIDCPHCDAPLAVRWAGCEWGADLVREG